MHISEVQNYRKKKDHLMRNEGKDMISDPHSKEGNRMHESMMPELHRDAPEDMQIIDDASHSYGHDRYGFPT